MFFLAPLVSVAGAAVEAALACEAAQMFVGGAAAAVGILSQRQRAEDSGQ